MSNGKGLNAVGGGGGEGLIQNDFFFLKEGGPNITTNKNVIYEWATFFARSIDNGDGEMILINNQKIPKKTKQTS